MSVEHEGALRLGFFLAAFALIALAERLRPRRAAAVPRRRRWIDNLGVFAISSAAVRLLLPIGEVAFAAWAAQQGWGLFNQTGWPLWLEFALAVLALDFVIYWQHRLFHAVPLLWRLHQMHHADLDHDLTTGSRFHPLEIVLSACIKLAAVAALGASPVAVLAFAVLLNVCAVFNHSNWSLPIGLDARLRLLLAPFRDPNRLTMPWMLALPFLRRKSSVD